MKIFHADWIEKIPSGWQIKPLKRVAFHTVSNVNKIPSPDEEAVRLCNYTDVYKNDFITLDLEFMKATATFEEIEKFGLLENDVIITKDSESWDDIAVPALVKETADDLICGYHLALLRPNPEKLEGRFLLRCLQTRVIRLSLELEATGVTRFGLPKDAIGDMPLPLPPLELQRRIADYLDAETTQIDALILEKERMLDLLEEKRAALISQAVTKGLDAGVKMKDSGLEWLGKVPAHWKLERAKQFFALREEVSESGEEELLTVSHITGVTSRAEKDVNMFKAEDMTGYKRCQPGDFVINTLWAWMGAMGIAWQEGIVSPAYHVYIPRAELIPEYVDLLGRSKPFVAEVIRFSKGVWSSRLRLYPESFLDIQLPVPPLSEQHEIVSRVEIETKKNLEFKNAIDDSLELLRERRSALITAAVTGQLEIDVVSA
jgi:type I restriction enzyme, S subunit